MDEKETLGAYIRNKRQQAGMTQKELAELLYVTESSVSNGNEGCLIQMYPWCLPSASVCTFQSTNFLPPAMTIKHIYRNGLPKGGGIW